MSNLIKVDSTQSLSRSSSMSSAVCITSESGVCSSLLLVSSSIQWLLDFAWPSPTSSFVSVCEWPTPAAYWDVPAAPELIRKYHWSLSDNSPLHLFARLSLWLMTSLSDWDRVSTKKWFYCFDSAIAKSKHWYISSCSALSRDHGLDWKIAESKVNLKSAVDFTCKWMVNPWSLSFAEQKLLYFLAYLNVNWV